MLGEIVMTFVPCLVFLALSLTIVACYRWVQHRKAQPGYAPLWALALVISTVLAFIVIGFGRMAAGQEPGYAGRHRKPRRPARTPLPIVSAGPVRAQAS